MLQHHLTLAFRNFKKFRATFVINLIGLTSGIACSMLIYLWINDELLFDKFHDAGDHLLQVMVHQKVNGNIETSENTTEFLADALAAEIPEVESAVVITPAGFFPPFTLLAKNKPVKQIGRFVDRDFFKVFSFQLVQGQADQSLNDKSNIVISESLGKALFGSSENLVGKSLTWEVMNIRSEVMITGVFKDIPKNSSLQFDFVLPFDRFREIMQMDKQNVNWDNPGPFATFILARAGADINTLNRKIADLLTRKSKNSAHRTLFIKPFSEKYLHGNYENGKISGGRIQYVILFSIVGGFILLIACINFINLSTASAVAKVRETGVKKAIGAARRTLIGQYMTESTVVTVISVFLALLAVSLLLPKFNELTGKSISLIPDVRMGVAVFVIIALTSILAGAYPSFYISRFSPVKALKGEIMTTAKGAWSRRGLVIFQFCLSVIFIAAVIIFQEQLTYIQNRNLGYDKDNVVYFDADGKVSLNIQTFLSELRKVDGVEEASSSLGTIIRGDGQAEPVDIDGQKVMLHNQAVNYGLLELLNLDVVAGRTFSPDIASDNGKVIFNEAAIRALGIDDPIGKTVMNGREIIGVVRDFNFQSFHKAVQPLVIRLEPGAVTTVMVKIKSGSERDAVENIRNFHNTYNPGFTFDFHFLDEAFDAQYAAEQKVTVLARYAAGLAVIITCLGLFGLTSFSTARRAKEISIRKILGSTNINIVMLISSEYFLVVVVSLLISLPISIVLSQQWLSSYAYRINLEAWHFIVAPCFIIVTAAATISVQTIRAAKANPLARLKSE